MTLTDPALLTDQPTAARLRPPSWRDPRLLIGLVLLLTSVTVGARVVALADDTHPVYAARATLPTGTPLTTDVLELVRLRLTGTRARYLDAAQPLRPGQILIRTIGAGELVPTAAIASAGAIQFRPVSIPIEGEPPVGLKTGALVDVWASAKRRDAVGGGYDEPERIAESVEVFGLRTPDTGLSASRAAAVEVLLPSSALAPVLDALANQARVVVLPLPGSTTRTQEDP
jgi:hypothetical protein